MKKLIPIILSIFFVLSYGATIQMESYPNGNKKSEGTMKGLFWKYKSGEWIYYYPSGNIKEIGNYKGIFGSENGIWTSYYENGQKWKEVSYKFGKDVGVKKEWYDNGQIKEEWGLLNNDANDGKWAAYYENGQIKEKWDLINNGTKYGKWISYYENGQIKEEEIYKESETEVSKSERSREEIINKYSFQDGTWTNYYTQDRAGKWISYYENGQIKKEGIYKDGWKDGIWIEWYDTGQKKVECTHNGTIVDPELGRSVHDGLYKVWAKDGQIKKEGNYIKGVQEWENVYIESNSTNLPLVNLCFCINSDTYYNSNTNGCKSKFIEKWGTSSPSDNHILLFCQSHCDDCE